MKFTTRFKFAALAAALFVSTLLVTSAAPWRFSGGNPTGTTNRAVQIISANGFIGGEIPYVSYLNATSDLASATATFYRAGSPTAITAASGGGTNRVFVGANGATFATSNQVIVLRHVASDTYERLVSFSNTVNTLQFTTATTAAVADGDLLYICAPDAKLAVGVTGATPKEWNVASGLYFGQDGRPLLFEVDATTSARIQAFSGGFLPRPTSASQ